MKEYDLLKQLCEVQGTSGDEANIRDFIIEYVKETSPKWDKQPTLYYGDGFQDTLVLAFGKPKLAAFAHIDTVGFTVRYENQLVSVGSPDAEDGTFLVGEDSLGLIRCKLISDPEGHAFYQFGRGIASGTPLSYEVDFKETRDYITTAYLDNRLGVFNLLKLAETLENGLLVFSTWEEHGGGSIPFLAKFMVEEFGVQKALISDITWVTDGVHHGKGTAISLRDINLPRKKFIDKITSIAERSEIPFQREVEAGGSSDGRELQTSPYPIDWCFVGAPIHGAHTPSEKVNKKDVKSMLALYKKFFEELD